MSAGTNAIRRANMPEVAEAPARSAALIKAARRITVKVGSSLLVEGDGVRRAWLASLGQDLARLRGEGRQIVIVSSGAVALGRRRLSTRHAGLCQPQRSPAPPGGTTTPATAWTATRPIPSLPTWRDSIAADGGGALPIAVTIDGRH